ncbi:MAG: glycosyl transferase [Clostridia bacterium]|nr:glycosyl transferase [Clostridia bacterium]
MKVLLLSCNTGQGHNSAAKAIKDYFEKHGVKCDIKDALAYWSEKSSKIISSGHVYIYRNLPKLFGIGYKFEENHPAKGDKSSFMYNLVTRGCKALKADLDESDYSAVVCTHIFPAMMLTKIKKKWGLDIPTYSVATDYTCCPGTSETDVDYYFIPHADLTDEFIAAGIPKAKLVDSGIPVNPIFYKKSSRAYAKGFLNLPEDKKIALIMCGSMGCGPIKQFVEMLPEMLPENAHLVVICGSNRRLYKSLNKHEHSNVSIIGYTTRISYYMDAASVILTKPGGLSSTEAAVKHLPMIFINAVPGCETRNFDFFLSRGFADSSPEISDLAELLCDYLRDESKTSNMEKKLKDNFGKFAAMEIYNCVCGVKEQPVK